MSRRLRFHLQWISESGTALLLLVLLAVPTAVSCTRGTNPLFSGTELKGSMTPFVNEGPMDICMAYHRVVSPDGQLSGFCQKLDAPQLRSCHSDEDCQDREACVCGKCTVQYCTRADECPQGMACDFTTSRCIIPCEGDCGCPGPNARCDIGVCQQMCIVDDECQSGEMCSLARARCTTFACHSDEDCLSDEHCIIQQEPRVMREPTLIKDDTGTYHMWLEMDQGSQERRVIFRASSRDGLSWSMDPPAPVLESDAQDGYRVGAPSVLRTASGYVMFFEVGDGRGFGRAQSTDGRNWSRDSNLVLEPLPDETAIHAPSVVPKPSGDGLLLYYQVGDGSAIRVVESSDLEGRTFLTSQRRTVIMPGEISTGMWRDVSVVKSPYAILAERGSQKVIYLWYSAYGYESGRATALDGSVSQIAANYSIGMASSLDGYIFTHHPNNPVFDRVTPNTFVTHVSELGPAVLMMKDGSYLLLYTDSDIEGTVEYGLGVARVSTRPQGM